MADINIQSLAFFVAPLAAVGFLLLFSATVFLSDHQQGTYRFFQQHVERPHWFWLARLVPWWLTIAAILAAFSIFAGSTIDHVSLARVNSYHLSGINFYIASHTGAFLSAGLVTALAIGQFWSMFVRNFAIAMVFSLITGAIVFSCVGWLIFLGASLAWFLMPFVIVLFWATSYRSRYWLADDRRWSRLFVPISVIAATVAISMAGYIYHRANAIAEPQLDLNNIAKYLEPNEQTEVAITELQFGTPKTRASTAALYRQAIDKLETSSFQQMGGGPEHMRRSWDYVRQWATASERRSEADAGPAIPDYDNRVSKFVAANQKSINLILRACQQSGCDPFLNADNCDKRWSEANQLRTLMMANCLVLLESNRNEETLESILAFKRVCQRTNTDPLISTHIGTDKSIQLFYDLLVRWSERPDQDAENIKAMIRYLEYTSGDQLPESFEVYQWGMDSERKQDEKQWAARFAWSNFHQWGGEAAWFGLIHRFRDIEEGTDTLTDVSMGPLFFNSWEKERAKRLLKLRAIEGFNVSFTVATVHNDQPLPKWWRPGSWSSVADAVSQADRRAFSLDSRDNLEARHLADTAEQETARRYTLLRLALSVYAIENGKYPQELHQLAKYFVRHLPKTVHASSNFGWLPAGLPAQGFYGGTYGAEIVKPNVPVLLPNSLAGPVDTTKREKFTVRGHDEEEQVGIPIPISGFELGYTLNIEPYLVALPEGKERD